MDDAVEAVLREPCVRVGSLRHICLDKGKAYGLAKNGQQAFGPPGATSVSAEGTWSTAADFAFARATAMSVRTSTSSLRAPAEAAACALVMGQAGTEAKDDLSAVSGAAQQVMEALDAKAPPAPR